MKKRRGKNRNTGRAFANFVKAVVFCALLTAVTAGAGFLLERKDSWERKSPFISEKANIDVLFLGTSHVMEGVYPMQLWRDYGISSYNLSEAQNTMAMAYWELQEALRYTEPSVVVLDLSRLRIAMKTPQQFSMVHKAFDGFPVSETKLRGGLDMLDDPTFYNKAGKKGSSRQNKAQRNILTYLWTLPLYHSRWKELGKSDLAPSANIQKGADYDVGLAVPAENEKIPASRALSAEGPGPEYLRRIIAECRSRNIGILLTYLPSPTTETQQKEAHTGARIAEEEGVEYLNFLDMDVVDFSTDLFDSTSHLNPSGARKVTDYLGTLLTEKYGVKDHRGEKEYARWDEEYLAYRAFRGEELRKVSDLFTYLMLLHDEEFDVLMEIGKGPYFTTKRMTSLLGNIGVDAEEASQGSFILLGRGAASVLRAEDRTEGTWESAAGTLRVEPVGDGTCARYLNGHEATVSAPLNPDKCWIRITVLDPDSGEIVDDVEFHYSVRAKKSTLTMREWESGEDTDSAVSGVEEIED